MAQSSQQSSNAQPAHNASVVQTPMDASYWNNIDGLYHPVDVAQPQQSQQPQPTQLPQHQQQRQQHQQQQQQPQPQGITWDHPIFSQQRSQQPQPQQPQQLQLSHSPQSQEHVRDLYAGTPQSWNQPPSTPQPTPISQPQGYGLSHQHPFQIQQYSPDQLSFDPQALGPGEPSFAPTYSLQGQYYQPAGLQLSDAYPQTQHRSIAPRPPTTPQPQLHAAGQQTTQSHRQYILPATNYAENVQGSSQYNQYADVTPTFNYQNTIDPRFLSSGQQGIDQAPSAQSQFLFYNPTASSYERPNDPKTYQMYPDNLAALNAEQLNARQQVHPQFSQLPELAPYPMPTGVLVPPGSAPPKTKTGTTKQKTSKVSKKGARKIDGKPGSESETDSSDSELEIEEPEEPSPLPPARPADAEGAAQYDSIKAVWSPRNRRPNAEKIKASLVAFKDVVKAVRDEWKTLSQAMKDAENQNNNDKAAELRKKVVQQRQVMNVVVSTTLDKGHPVILEKLGEHPMAVAALYSFLLDRHQASDYEGVLLVNILKLLERFITVDEDTLSKTNVSKLLPRIIKKGAQPGKDLAQKILDNAAASTKRKQEAAANQSSKDNTPDRASESSRSDSAAGIKRPRDGETNGHPINKKPVSLSTAKASAAVKTAGSSAVRPGDNKSTAPATRPKASIAPPKPTSLFGSLASASKKPGTSNAARAAAAAAAAKEKANAPVEKKESPVPAPAKPAFSFGDILADLNKKEEAKAPKAAENTPPETEEEREKRLRKEARRKLRVSWKPESSLVEVRLFTHDPDEEIGADDELKRDVADIKGEGRMLRLHKDLELDDEEESGPQEEEIHPWTSLTTVVDGLSSEDQANNFIKRGGTKEPDSPEKLAQENRESNTLMVFYSSPADVPPSPKEPPESSEEEQPPTETTFGEPDDNVKGRSARYFAMVNPPPPSKPATPPVTTPANGPIDIANLLKVIQNTPQQAQSTPPPQPTTAQTAPLSNLERTINMFRQQQGQPAQTMPQIPPIPQIPQAAAPPAQPIDFQKILAVLNAQKQLGAQQQPPPQPPLQLPPSQPTIAPNLAALVSQLSGSNAAPPVSQSPPQYSGLYEDPERKRLRDGGRGYENGSGQGNAKRPRMYVDPEAKKHPRAGSVPCRFWRENKCLKGDDCTFRHDPADLD